MTAMLTSRQRAVLALVATGATNAEIAAALGVSVSRVNQHLDKIAERLGLPMPVPGRLRIQLLAAFAASPGVADWQQYLRNGCLVFPSQREALAVLGAVRKHRLTPRQREVLGQMAAGAHNNEIAAALAIHPGRVKWHLTRIYDRLGVRNRAEATALYLGVEVA